MSFHGTLEFHRAHGLRFEAAFVHRLRVAVAAMVLRAWQREGVLFVRLVWSVADLPPLVVRVKRCSRVGCLAPRLPQGERTGLLCAVHEREGYAAVGLPVPGVVVEHCTWPVDSEEARELVAMTLALGARYEGATDPFEPGVDFEARVAELRAQLDSVDAARCEVA